VTKASAVPPWQRALYVLTSTVVGVVIVAAMYWAQVVFIPLALAIFLAFLLNPSVKFLQHRGGGRIPSVIVVVVLAGLFLAGIGWIAARQVAGLLDQLPNYTANITRKIESLQEWGAGSAPLAEMVDQIGRQLKHKPDSAPVTPGSIPAPARPAEPPTAVVMQPESPGWLGRLPHYFGPAMETLGSLALALVLAIFMLLKREDLRNRFIRLVGHGQLTFTTKAVDEAGQRISRYLLMQLVVNVSYGLVLGIALFLIGLDHALLWGLMAAVLRYIPYLGAVIVAGLLLALSLAMFPAWVQPLLVLAVILVLELVTSNLVEPLLFGHSLGVSEVALLISAAFWAFLWGPVGLVLSGPLTVCLVVLGRYVPQLQFIDVLLGAEPALDPKVSYYQRLLARDQDEATALVLAQEKLSSPEQVYDEMLVPGLNFTKRDRERDELTAGDEQFILRATREIVEDLGECQASAAGENGESKVPKFPKIRVLGCPGHDEADALALTMLQQLLDPARWAMEILSTEVLSAELVTLAEENGPAIVCISALPPGGLAHTRYLCKRLRARLPRAKILVGRWGLQGNLEQNQDQLREAGADEVETTLLETRDHLLAWLPVLAQDALKRVESRKLPADAGRTSVLAADIKVAY
jgi:predicted PurR-regulated permease PerM